MRKVAGYPNKRIQTENSGMHLKMSTTTLSLHSFIALAAWAGGKLISSPSSSDEFAKSLLAKWCCGFVFLFSCPHWMQQQKADSKAKQNTFICPLFCEQNSVANLLEGF